VREHSLLEVSLYLLGDHLDPEAVTRTIGVTPDDAHRRGEMRRLGGVDKPHKTSLWRLSRKAHSANVSAALLALLGDLDPAKVSEVASCADDAFIDVFMATTVDQGELEASIEFELSIDAICALKSLNLPVKFSVSNTVGEGSR